MNNITENKNLDLEMLATMENQLDKEILLYKKYLAYGKMCYDAELKNLCYEASKKHKSNYEKILSFLKMMEAI